MYFLIFSFFFPSMISSYSVICVPLSCSLDLCRFVNILKDKYSMLNFQTLFIIAQFLFYLFFGRQHQVARQGFSFKRKYALHSPSAWMVWYSKGNFPSTFFHIHMAEMDIWSSRCWKHASPIKLAWSFCLN